MGREDELHDEQRAEDQGEELSVDVELVEQFREPQHKDAADRGAGDRADAGDHHDRSERDRVEEVVRGRAHRLDLHGEQPSAETRDRRRDREGRKLPLGEVQAHRGGRNFRLTDRAQNAARLSDAQVPDQERNEQEDHESKEVERVISGEVQAEQRGSGRGSRGDPAGERVPRTVGEQIPVRAKRDAQGEDREEQPREAKRRDPDEEPSESREQDAERQ